MAKYSTQPQSQQTQAQPPQPRIMRVIFERPLQVLGRAERISASTQVSIARDKDGIVIQTATERELIPWHLIHTLSLERSNS